MMSNETEKYVRTNMGDVPLEDYYDIRAQQFGYDSYADMKKMAGD